MNQWFAGIKYKVQEVIGFIMNLVIKDQIAERSDQFGWSSMNDIDGEVGRFLNCD